MISFLLAAACVSSLARCPAEGCHGDSALNRMKNRGPVPVTSIVEWRAGDFASHMVRVTGKWKRGSPRTALAEDVPVKISGFLLRVKQAEPEACNCYLEGPENTDIHMNLADTPGAPLSQSVVVEWSPRNPRPSLATLRSLVGHRIRVTGWRMLDTEHLAGTGGPRATLWEVHPITQVEKLVREGIQWKWEVVR